MLDYIYCEQQLHMCVTCFLFSVHSAWLDGWKKLFQTHSLCFVRLQQSTLSHNSVPHMTIAYYAFHDPHAGTWQAI